MVRTMCGIVAPVKRPEEKSDRRELLRFPKARLRGPDRALVRNGLREHVRCLARPLVAGAGYFRLEAVKSFLRSKELGT